MKVIVTWRKNKTFQAYFGYDLEDDGLGEDVDLKDVRKIFSSELVVRGGMLTDLMCQDTTNRTAVSACLEWMDLHRYMHAEESLLNDRLGSNRVSFEEAYRLPHMQIALFLIYIDSSIYM